MWDDILNNLVAATVGVATGFYFERRTTKAALAEKSALEALNHQLHDELRRNRTELLGRLEIPAVPDNEVNDTVEAAIIYARTYQNAVGRIKVSVLRSGLVKSGFKAAEVEAAFDRLLSDHRFRRVGAEFEVTS